MRKDEYTKVKGFDNIYEKVGKNKRKSFYVRFKYRGVDYYLKNFTYHFGSRNASAANDAIITAKGIIANGGNPFEKKQVIKTTLNDYFYIYIKNIQGEDKYIKTKYYEKHIKPIIGNKKLDTIEEEHIHKVLNSPTLKNLSRRSKNTTRMILSPIFKKAIKNKLMTINPLEEIKFVKSTKKKPLESKLVDDEKTVVQKIYNLIMAMEDLELKTIFLFALMVGRRRSEILRLTREDIRDDKVFASYEITKTQIDEKYPLPSEIIKLLNILPNDNPIFKYHKDHVTKQYTKMIKESDIQFSKNEHITFHETRHLFTSIMTIETRNFNLVDKCISHTKNEDRQSTYLSFSYENRKKVFEDYWEICRGNKVSDTKITLTTEHIDNLKKLTDMYNDGLITKEEFLSMK